MPQSSGDDKDAPSLELPTLKLPRLSRRGGRRREEAGQEPREADRQEPREAEPRRPEATPAAEHTIGHPHAATTVHEQRREGEAGRRPLPQVPARLAAALAGVLTGLLGAGLTVAARAGCEAVRGVGTCGGAPGLLLLLAILTMMVLAGALVLRALRVHDATGTSFLGVGIVAVLTMLLFLEVVDSAWMFVVVPLLGAGGFLVSHWVTSRFEDEPVGRRREWM